MLHPTFIDLGPDSRASSATGFSRSGAPSPRIQHYDGDIPPSLSPLDAFAAHSRRLAKELEETRLAGERRMSRLSPQIVTQALSEHQKSRPQIFRALSDGVDGLPTMSRQSQEASGNSIQVAKPKRRPISEYPRLSGIPRLEDVEDEDEFHTPTEEINFKTPQQPPQIPDFLGIARAESPRLMESLQLPSDSPSRQKQEVTHHSPTSPDRKASQTSQFDRASTLDPPNPAFARNKANYESSDDDYASSHAGSTFSKARRLSSSSGFSGPHSPTSPYLVSHGRSGSNNSKASLPESKIFPRQFNFSHPMSSGGLDNVSRSGLFSRKESLRSPDNKAPSNDVDPPKTSSSFDEVRSETSDGFVSTETSSYTHATFILPRGRMAGRNSAVFLGLSTPHFEWQEPMFPNTPPLSPRPDTDLPHLSPINSIRTSHDTDTKTHRSGSSDLASSSPRGVENQIRRPSTSNSAKSSKDTAAPKLSRPFTSHVAVAPNLPPIPSGGSDAMSRSSRSNSTVRPTTARTVSNYQALSADEHLSKAIELHQHGDLKESTYHLRIAAKQDHPTGMLLYALACRHGWGMRPNQRDGVQWLRKAVDMAILEVADDEDPSPDKPKADVSEKKTHRAQFALSIYELGVSHLNGWGIEQDKALALRCFEIAGNWGDLDALTEAGFCYAEGIGCKKDLKKAAKFYRMAESRGVSMVGNSWIHKDKYNDNDGDGSERRSRASRKSSTEKARNKSKTRSIFARKR